MRRMPLTTTPCRQSDGVSGCLEILEKEQQLQVGIFVKKTLYCTLFGKLLQPEAIFRLKCIKAFDDRALPGPIKQSKAKEVFDEGALVASMLSKLH